MPSSPMLPLNRSGPIWPRGLRLAGGEWPPDVLRRKTAVLYLRNKICGKFARHARNENVARLKCQLRHFKLDQLALLPPEQFWPVPFSMHKVGFAYVSQRFPSAP